MKKSRIQVFEQICEEIRKGNNHILITGGRGSGKTTMLQKLLGAGLLSGGERSGICSFAVRNQDGIPQKIILRDRLNEEEQAIAEGFVPGKGPCVKADVLDNFGVQALFHALQSDSQWAVIDEVGFLENASAEYCKMLIQLFDKKRVAAVLRKKETPLIQSILRRNDVVCFDLDGIPKDKI